LEKMTSVVFCSRLLISQKFWFLASIMASKYETLRVSGLGLDIHGLGFDLGFDVFGVVNITDSFAHSRGMSGALKFNNGSHGPDHASLGVICHPTVNT